MEQSIRQESAGHLLEKARATVGELTVKASYADNYQPVYLDPDYLVEAVHELHTTEAVTQPSYVDELQAELTAIALGKSDRPIVITGNCSERIMPVDTPIERLIEGTIIGLQTVEESELAHALHIRRERGQNTKPRSEENEVLADKNIVMSYMGDAINDPDPTKREPDPARLVAAGIQARDIEQALTQTVGRHVPAAHEALNLLYERSFMRTDPKSGKTYLLSADLPWIGVRTNHPDSDHVELLSQVANPVGVKLDHTTTAAHIEELNSRLNPDNIPGKLVLMPRVGLNQIQTLPALLEAIKVHAPGSLILFDIHGSTKKLPGGKKTRVVSEITREIELLSRASVAKGLKLHGVHLETTHDTGRLECVNEPDEEPRHPGGIDPQLNPNQTRQVLNEAAPYLLAS